MRCGMTHLGLRLDVCAYGATMQWDRSRSGFLEYQMLVETGGFCLLGQVVQMQGEKEWVGHGFQPVGCFSFSLLFSVLLHSLGFKNRILNLIEIHLNFHTSKELKSYLKHTCACTIETWNASVEIFNLS